ncbi:hypothetical protein EVAR_103965_1 [Eumeta japonica]|uniref:Uncharacterized protein n=1 Tax=Eumeta variegata TaxID=151549 RepID=A0A4C1YEC8_EUMVA|nr:hypothetical protein EVAR_103965_1 [Eumeta japonica]
MLSPRRRRARRSFEFTYAPAYRPAPRRRAIEPRPRIAAIVDRAALKWKKKTGSISRFSIAALREWKHIRVDPPKNVSGRHAPSAIETNYIFAASARASPMPDVKRRQWNVFSKRYRNVVRCDTTNLNY